MNFSPTFRFLRAHPIAVALTVAAVASISLVAWADASVEGVAFGLLLGVVTYLWLGVMTWDFRGFGVARAGRGWRARVGRRWRSRKAQLVRLLARVAVPASAAFAVLWTILCWRIAHLSALECIGIFSVVTALHYWVATRLVLLVEQIIKWTFRQREKPALFSLLVMALWCATNSYSPSPYPVQVPPPRLNLAA